MKYRLGWFLGTSFGLQPWIPSVAFNAQGFMDGPWTGNNAQDWMKPDIYIDLARSLERAGFDFLMFQDTSDVPQGFEGCEEMALRRGLFAPKNDPLPLLPVLAGHTKHIGLVATMSSTFYPPYLAARLLTTLDHLTNGRVGFNLVTSIMDSAAANYGMDSIPPKAERYEMAAEWVDVIKKLQESWEPDAVIADVVNRTYADHTKVHRIDHSGKYFRCRGPLNTMPGPQRSVPMIEAGNSPEGLDVAARFGEVFMAYAFGVEHMKALRKDIHDRMRAYGRDPTEQKVMFLVDVQLGATDDEARRRFDEQAAGRLTDESMENVLWNFNLTSGLDLRALDLDMPAEEAADALLRSGRGEEMGSVVRKRLLGDGSEEARRRSLRKALASNSGVPDLGLVGSPETVAAKMDEIMEEVGGDGFLFYPTVNRHTIAQICDGLAPVLQRRGSIRSAYRGRTFRDNLNCI